MMRRFGAGLVLAVAAAAAGCEAELEVKVSTPVAAAAEEAAPKRLPIGEITVADVPALMAAVYPEGVPETVKDLGVFVMGERAGLLVGADNADTCAACPGSLSFYFLARMDTGFVVQAEHRDFHASGSGGKFNREIRVEQLGGVDGGPSYAGFVDVNRKEADGCAQKTVTVGVFIEAGPRIALTAPFGARGAQTIDAKVIEAEPFQADFAIAYDSRQDDFVVPYLFVNNGLRPSFPAPAWTQATC